MNNSTKTARYIEMTETPIHKLIPKSAIPTIISMLITTIYSMADTYFVSQLEDAAAAAAVGIIFSLATIIQTLGMTVGIGSANAISISLGQKNVEKAKRVVSTSFYTILILGIMVMVIGLATIEPLVYILGATETIAPYAMDYAKYVLLATPFMASSLVLNTSLRSQGNAFYAMLGLTTGGIINIILDPIFIFYFDLGISGAAIATGISQFISFCILYYQCNHRENSIKIKLQNFKPTLQIYKEIFILGGPTFCRLGLSTIASILLNLAAKPFGDFALAAIGIINRIILFMYAILIGYGQGFQPIAGFNYGAKRYDRVLASYYFSLKVAVVLTVISGATGFIFAEQVIRLFRPESEIIEIGAFMLRAQCVILPLQSITTISNMLTQSIGYSFKAMIIATARQGTFFIPLILILPNILGLKGVQLTQPIADIFAVMVAIYIGSGVVKKLKELQREQELQKVKQG